MGYLNAGCNHTEPPMSLNQIGDAQDPYFPDVEAGLDVQIFCLAEEISEAIEAAYLGAVDDQLRDALVQLARAAGRATQAHRQTTGRARRSDLTTDDFGFELADIVIVASHAARLRNLDLDSYVAAKLATIRDRRQSERVKTAIEKMDDAALRVVGPGITDHDPAYITKTLDEARRDRVKADPQEPMCGYPVDGKRSTQGDR